KITTEPLLSMANTNASRLDQYHHRLPPLGEARPRAGGDGGSACRKHRTDTRESTIATKPLRCAIQATDSTFTGCTPNSIAARKAPGMAMRRKMLQISSAATTWKHRLVTW